MNVPAPPCLPYTCAVRRYLQLAVITVAAGAIYPLLYLRQNFEVSMLETFEITATQLGQCNAILGVMFVVTYLPSGWLAGWRRAT